MDRAGGHVEGGRDQDQLCPLVSHDPEKLGEANVKADGDAQLAQRCVDHGDLVPGGQSVGLHEALTARHVDVEEMDFPVAGQLLPFGRKEVTGVVDGVPLPFGHGAAGEIDAQLFGDAGQKLPGLAPGGFRVHGEAGVFIGAVEHFRQQDQLRALAGGSADGLFGGAEIFGLVSCHLHLTQAQLNGPHRQAPFLSAPQWGAAVFSL